MLSLGTVVGLFYGVTLVAAILILYGLYRLLKDRTPLVQLTAGLALVLSCWIFWKLAKYYLPAVPDSVLGISLRYFRIEITVVLFIAGASSVLSAAIKILLENFTQRRLNQEEEKVHSSLNQRRGRARIFAAFAVPEAAKLLGISRAAAYRFASAGDLPIKRLGRRVYVVTARLREFIEPKDQAA